jgi:peptidoglycan/xylan/chitin deacetylase (PgdA/CDA1 family)
VLSYHRIGDAVSSELHRGLFSAAPEMLDRQLRLLKRHFDVIPPAQLGEDLLSAHGRHVLVTFDDGYRDLYELAHPVLLANDVRALMFLCTGFIDGHAHAWWDEIAWMLRRTRLPQLPPGPWAAEPLPLGGSELERAIEAVTRAYWGLEPDRAGVFLEQLASAARTRRRTTSTKDWITWEMAREMQAAGHEIGAHTETHPILSTLPRAGQLREIATSLDRLAAELGERPRCLAYPVGTRQAFDASTLAATREAGVELAFSNYGGRVTPATFAPLDVRRVSTEKLRSEALFSATLNLPQVLA